MLDTLVVTLLLTLPSSLARSEWIPPELRESPSESLAVTCELGENPLTDLESLRVYAYPSSGGGWRLVHVKGVRGREGLEDSTTLSFPGWEGAHFYVTTVRTGSARESCPSATAYKGTVTAVPDPPSSSRIPRAEWYDIRGRRLRAPPKGSGVYFVRWVLEGRAVRVQKVPVIRGRPLVPLRP